MLMQTGSGVGVEVHASRPSELFSLIGLGTDEQIRGLLSRLLRDAGIPQRRASKILRVGRSQYYDDLVRPFPGINENPRTNQSRRIWGDGRDDDYAEGD